MNPELLKILCCPETHQSLSMADSQLVQQVNAGIEKGELKNKAGKVVLEKLVGGLLREDRKVIYPIREVPVLLVDEAIELSGK